MGGRILGKIRGRILYEAPGLPDFRRRPFPAPSAQILQQIEERLKALTEDAFLEKARVRHRQALSTAADTDWRMRQDRGLREEHRELTLKQIDILDQMTPNPFLPETSPDRRKERELLRERLDHDHEMGKRHTARTVAAWGVFTLRAVGEIASEVVGHLEDRSNDSYPNYGGRWPYAQDAEYYCGLLCAELGLLPQTDVQDKQGLASVVRSRLNRSGARRER